MAREPKHFAIETVGNIVPAERWYPVRVSATASVPHRFTAWVVLAHPRIRVDIDLQVVPGGGSVVRELAVTPGVDGAAPINTSTLRGILVDQIVRAVIARAAESTEGKVIDRPELHPDAFTLEGGPDNIAWVSRRPGVSDRIVWAARVYRAARSAGSRAPTEAVASELRVSRSQASRYVRSARDKGLLPEAEEGRT